MSGGKIDFQLVPPKVPNVVRVQMAGVAGLSSIPVAVTNQEQRDWLAEQFRKGLDEVAEMQSKIKEQEK